MRVSPLSAFPDLGSADERVKIRLDTAFSISSFNYGRQLFSCHPSSVTMNFVECCNMVSAWTCLLILLDALVFEFGTDLYIQACCTPTLIRYGLDWGLGATQLEALTSVMRPPD